MRPYRIYKSKRNDYTYEMLIEGDLGWHKIATYNMRYGRLSIIMPKSFFPDIETCREFIRCCEALAYKELSKG